LTKTDADDIHETFFSDSKKASKAVEIVSFEPFGDTAEAVSAATATLEGKVSTQLKDFLKISKKKLKGDLAIEDKALAVSLKDENYKNLQIVHDSKSQEIFRGIRHHLDELLNAEDEVGISPQDLKAMQLGLSHSLSRYKLKFSADKVDTMVIQAVGLLDELDKEINTYAMRVKEWYGWHFPELQALVSDNASYAQLVLKCGMRPDYAKMDLSSILEDESVEATVKENAEISMGTEIADLDILNIKSLAEQVLSLTEYRSQLFEYLKNRMNAIAPNLTILVGELVGARLISHAGSLMNLAKQPASTVQILGAEKALFRALKTKHDTPKYGLIYHASLVGQAAPKNKGKISRVLAAKAALAIRVDALTDDTGEAMDTTIGFEGRAKVEARLRQLEGGSAGVANPFGSLTAKKTAKYTPVAAKTDAAASGYNASSDMVLDTNGVDVESDSDDKAEKKKKKKKDKEEKKKKKRKSEAVVENGDDSDDEKAKKKAKKAKKEKKKE
jgi:nucleolar protein 58